MDKDEVRLGVALLLVLLVHTLFSMGAMLWLVPLSQADWWGEVRGQCGFVSGLGDGSWRFGENQALMSSRLSLDLSEDSVRPYFLWSEDMTLGELKAVLAGDEGDYLRWVYASRVLREACMQDVWLFFTPSWIWTNWDKLAPGLGGEARFLASLFVGLEAVWAIRLG